MVCFYDDATNVDNAIKSRFIENVQKGPEP